MDFNMAVSPRGYTRKEVQTVRQRVAVGQKTATIELDASTTVEEIRFGDAFSKVSFQATGTLQGTIEFSISGQNWVNSTAIPAANAIGTFSTHNVEGVRITRTSGSGQLFIAAT
jgi:hypothetical protein